MIALYLVALQPNRVCDIVAAGYEAPPGTPEENVRALVSYAKSHYAEWSRLRLSEEQVHFFERYGYLSGVRILSDEQVDALCAALERLTQPSHPGRHLFYEFHSNESKNPNEDLFHALGAWRIEEDQ